MVFTKIKHCYAKECRFDNNCNKYWNFIYRNYLRVNEYTTLNVSYKKKKNKVRKVLPKYYT